MIIRLSIQRKKNNTMNIPRRDMKPNGQQTLLSIAIDLCSLTMGVEFNGISTCLIRYQSSIYKKCYLLVLSKK